jgi:hypothetical protein
MARDASVDLQEGRVRGCSRKMQVTRPAVPQSPSSPAIGEKEEQGTVGPTLIHLGHPGPSFMQGSSSTFQLATAFFPRSARLTLVASRLRYLHVRKTEEPLVIGLPFPQCIRVGCHLHYGGIGACTSPSLLAGAARPQIAKFTGTFCLLHRDLILDHSHMFLVRR